MRVFLQSIATNLDRLVAVFLCFLTLLPAQAGTLRIDPVRLELLPEQSIAALTVHNDGPQAALMQLEIMAWRQANGEDIYQPSRELLASPPIFTVPAGASQIVRIGLRRAVDPAQELTYRLYLQEIPLVPAEFQGAQVVLRIGVPVFVAPPVKTAAKLAWHAARRGDAIELTLINSGNAHIQLAAVELYEEDSLFASQQLSSYVLAGQTQRWLIKPKHALKSADITTVGLKALTDAGEISAKISFAQP